MIDNSLLVVTYLWDDPKFKFRSQFKYKPEHVVALYQQLKRFLHVPFYFTVVCDEVMLKKMEGWTHNFDHQLDKPNVVIDPNLDRIDTYRIWDDCKEMGRCWRRLRGFSAYEFGHLSRVLFIDLDMMILDNITPLIHNNRNEPFVMADDSECKNSKYNGSFILFTPTPTTHKMWATFNRDPEACKKLLETKGWQGSDQAWIRYYMDEVAHEPVKTIGKDDGLLSFRWHCMNKNIDPFEAGAKMVNFHGPYMPDMEDVQESYRWTKLYDAYGNRTSRGGKKSISNMTPERLRRCVEIIENGGINKDMADFMGMSRVSVSRYFKKHPELVEARKVRDSRK